LRMPFSTRLPIGRLLMHVRPPASTVKCPSQGLDSEVVTSQVQRTFLSLIWSTRKLEKSSLRRSSLLCSISTTSIRHFQRSTVVGQVSRPASSISHSAFAVPKSHQSMTDRGLNMVASTSQTSHMARKKDGKNQIPLVPETFERIMKDSGDWEKHAKTEAFFTKIK